jgi:hypothetical protein
MSEPFTINLGPGASEGVNVDEHTPQKQEDGCDAIEWLTAQPRREGHVNMMGISYGGFTWLQVTTHAPPHLTSIIPVDFTDDRYTDDCHYRGGLVRKYYDIGWYGGRMIAWGAMPPYPDWSGTASHFHMTIDLALTVNNAPYFRMRWAESIPRQLP